MLLVAAAWCVQVKAQEETDRTKAYGYQFTETELAQYPQKTNLPTVYLEVYKTTVVDGKAQPIAEGETPELEDLNTVFGTKNDWYYNAQIIIRDDKGTIEERKEPTTVRGRGNATWDISANSDGLLKKPLRLKFPQKTALLGDGYANEKSWVLLANHLDPTLIRNAMANEVGHIVGLPFCPAYKFVDLIVNGTYMGTYQISDQVQVGEKRVPINEATGYFIEAHNNKRAGFLEDPFLLLTFNNQTMCVNVKSPDPSGEYEQTASDQEIHSNPTGYETKDPQYSELKSFLTNIASLVYTGSFSQSENWRKYVNLDNAVRAFIGEDLTGNYDGAVANNYAYINDLESKLCFGPLWDFDLAWGGYGDMSKKHFYEGEWSTFGTLCNKVFSEDPYFVKALYEFWQTIYNDGQLVTDLQGRVDAISSSIGTSAGYNFSAANDGGAGESTNNWANSYTDHATAVEAMKTFIEEHIAWLNSEYKNKYESLGCANLAEIPDENGSTGPAIDDNYNVDIEINSWNDCQIPGKAFNSKAKSALITVSNAKYVKFLDKSDSNSAVVLKEYTYNNDGVEGTYTVTGDLLEVALSGNIYFNCDGNSNITVTVKNIGCDAHSYNQYKKQEDGTYRQVCTDCGKVDNDNVIYKFTVYPESAVSTELYAKSWEPTNENPNSIAMISVTADDAPNGTNIVNNETCADFVLTDGHPFYCPSKFTATQATYSRSVTNDWGTIVLPFKYQQASNETVSFYHLKEVSNAGDDKQLVLTPIDPTQDGNASAYTPVFFKRADESVDEITVTGSNVKVKASTEPMSRTTGDWTLKGAMTETVKIDVQDGTWSGKNIYYISNNQFWHATGKVNIKPFRAYLESTKAVSSAIGLMVDDGETTGMLNVNVNDNANANRNWYTLDGRLLNGRPTAKGIYIHNGRKEVVR